MAVLLAGVSVAASQIRVAVLYPDVRAPYDRIFNDILKGISEASAGMVKTYPVTKDDSLDRINDWLQTVRPNAVISLGSLGKQLADPLSRQWPMVIGATLFSDENIAQGMFGISLTPAPDKLFARLRLLAPEVKVVHVVYHPRISGWLINLAKHQSAAFGLDVRAVAATDVRQAAAVYQQILARSASGKEAVWLLQGDPTLDERSLLPTILSQAWNHDYVVYSSNPSHVKRGALFSLYPDNARMGSSLVGKAERVVQGQDRDVDPLEDLLVAVNIRTAEHLALKFSRAQMREFNLVFPAK